MHVIYMCSNLYPRPNQSLKECHSLSSPTWPFYRLRHRCASSLPTSHFSIFQPSLVTPCGSSYATRTSQFVGFRSTMATKSPPVILRENVCKDLYHPNINKKYCTQDNSSSSSSFLYQKMNESING